MQSPEPINAITLLTCRMVAIHTPISPGTSRSVAVHHFHGAAAHIFDRVLSPWTISQGIWVTEFSNLHFCNNSKMGVSSGIRSSWVVLSSVLLRCGRTYCLAAFRDCRIVPPSRSWLFGTRTSARPSASTAFHILLNKGTQPIQGSICGSRVEAPELKTVCSSKWGLSCSQSRMGSSHSKILRSSEQSRKGSTMRSQ
jgi:hypothetical protein